MDLCKLSAPTERKQDKPFMLKESNKQSQHFFKHFFPRKNTSLRRKYTINIVSGLKK